MIFIKSVDDYHMKRGVVLGWIRSTDDNHPCKGVMRQEIPMSMDELIINFLLKNKNRIS